MWIYVQSEGTLKHVNETIGRGYSGAGDCKNNPLMQRRHNQGPIPCGLYKIGSPYDSDTHGPFVLPLAPNMDNEMFGRSAFLIHGDSIANPGAASQGCIVMDREVRGQVYASDDKLLEVVAYDSEVNQK